VRQQEDKAKTGSSLERVVKIGHAAPLTGASPTWARTTDGAKLAIDEANARGTTIGGEKIVFELLSEDDEGKPDKGPIIAQKFVDAKVAGVVGHLNSGVTIPASAVYNQAGIPMISGSATNPKLTEQDFNTVFRTVGRDDQQGPAIASYLSAQYQPKTVAVIDDATAYGEGIANEVEKTLKAAGVVVLPREKGTDKTTDWKAILTKLKGKNPDAVFYGGMDLRRPDAEAGARTRHQGRVAFATARHGQDEGAGGVRLPKG
jgi:branched-chain amino acid transport system substrate-binding protein